MLGAARFTTPEEAVLSQPVSRTRAAQRSSWVDAAKAISILLIVTWHTLDQSWPINAWLGVVRVPLFFFTSGFFVAKSLRMPLRTFLRDRVGHLLFLYVLWTVIYFLTLTVVASLGGKTPPYAILARMFFAPVQTLWFIYVLAITFALARVFRHMPPLLLAGLLVILYSWSFSGGDWRNLPLPDRIVRAAPFFFLGSFAFRTLDANIRTYDRLWLLTLAFYVCIQLFASRFLGTIGPVMLVVPLIGVLALLLLASWSQRTIVATALSYIGARTIQVFLLHRLLLYILDPILKTIGIAHPYSNFMNLFIVIAVALGLGRIFERRLPWLFEAPWRLRPGPGGCRLAALQS